MGGSCWKTDLWWHPNPPASGPLERSSQSSHSENDRAPQETDRSQRAGFCQTGMANTRPGSHGQAFDGLELGQGAPLRVSCPKFLLHCSQHMDTIYFCISNNRLTLKLTNTQHAISTCIGAGRLHQHCRSDH